MFEGKRITEVLKAEATKEEIIVIIKDSISDWFINDTKGILKLETCNYDFFCESLRDIICNYFKVGKD